MVIVRLLCYFPLILLSLIALCNLFAEAWAEIATDLIFTMCVYGKVLREISNHILDFILTICCVIHFQCMFNFRIIVKVPVKVLTLNSDRYGGISIFCRDKNRLQVYSGFCFSVRLILLGDFLSKFSVALSVLYTLKLSLVTITKFILAKISSLFEMVPVFSWQVYKLVFNRSHVFQLLTTHRLLHFIHVCVVF